jgi:hypothetical protein
MALRLNIGGSHSTSVVECRLLAFVGHRTRTANSAPGDISEIDLGAPGCSHLNIPAGALNDKEHQSSYICVDFNFACNTVLVRSSRYCGSQGLERHLLLRR